MPLAEAGERDRLAGQLVASGGYSRDRRICRSRSSPAGRSA
jgi:hypothetical protein